MDRILLIEKYFKGLLTESQQKEFDYLLSTDKSFADEINLHHEVDEAILDDDLHNFRKNLNEHYSKLKPKSSKRFTFNKNLIKLPIAASTVFLIGISLWKIFANQSPEELYASNYTPYETDFSTRSAESISDKVQLAYMLYQKGEYDTSFEILDNYLLKNYDNLTARFFYGMNALELGNTELATEQLTEVEKNVSTPYSIHARWYLAMVYLKTANIELAKKYLKMLVEEENFYSEKAKTVLESLGS